MKEETQNAILKQLQELKHDVQTLPSSKTKEQCEKLETISDEIARPLINRNPYGNFAEIHDLIYEIKEIITQKKEKKQEETLKQLQGLKHNVENFSSLKIKDQYEELEKNVDEFFKPWFWWQNKTDKYHNACELLNEIEELLKEKEEEELLEKKKEELKEKKEKKLQIIKDEFKTTIKTPEDNQGNSNYQNETDAPNDIESKEHDQSNTVADSSSLEEEYGN